MTNFLPGAGAKCRKIHIFDFFQIKRANARSPWKLIKTFHFLSYTKEPLEKNRS